MLQCSYAIYKALLKQFPYVPGPDAEYAAKALEQVTARIAGAPEDQRDLLLALADNAEALANDRGRYGFLLGLDAGLSLSRELIGLQKEW